MCPRGLKQGDIYSPILFSLFINELATEIIQNGKHGITLSPKLIQILIMLFADDVVLLSYTVIGLQQQLNILRDTAKKLGLVVNLQKSNVVVFRKGGHIAAREKWFYDGMKLEIVNRYKYLGVIFSTGLTFSYAHEDVANRAKKGVVDILTLLRTMGDLNPLNSFSNCLIAKFSLCLLMVHEIWGLIADNRIIESIH